jgi:hypothetical protein
MMTMMVMTMTMMMEMTLMRGGQLRPPPSPPYRRYATRHRAYAGAAARKPSIAHSATERYDLRQQWTTARKGLAMGATTTITFAAPR